jgi:hypothetical protein
LPLTTLVDGFIVFLTAAKAFIKRSWAMKRFSVAILVLCLGASLVPSSVFADCHDRCQPVSMCISLPDDDEHYTGITCLMVGGECFFISCFSSADTNRASAPLTAHWRIASVEVRQTAQHDDLSTSAVQVPAPDATSPSVPH